MNIMLVDQIFHVAYRVSNDTPGSSVLILHLTINPETQNVSGSADITNSSQNPPFSMSRPVTGYFHPVELDGKTYYSVVVGSLVLFRAAPDLSAQLILKEDLKSGVGRFSYATGFDFGTGSIISETVNNAKVELLEVQTV